MVFTYKTCYIFGDLFFQDQCFLAERRVEFVGEGLL